MQDAYLPPPKLASRVTPKPILRSDRAVSLDHLTAPQRPLSCRIMGPANRRLERGCVTKLATAYRRFRKALTCQ